MSKLSIASLIIAIVGSIVTWLNTQESINNRIDKRFDAWAEAQNTTDDEEES